MKTNVMKRTKTWLVSALFCVMAFCLAVGGGNLIATQVGKASAEIELYMHEGGSLRCESDTQSLGLGFLTYINYTDYNGLVETYDEVKTGTLFVRKSDAYNAGIQTLNNDNFKIEVFEKTANLTYADVVNEGWKNAATAEIDGTYQFRGSVVGIKSENVEKEYCARGYLAYKDAGSDTWSYEYTAYNEQHHCRSIAQVAQDALNDTSTVQEGNYQYEVRTGVYSKYDSDVRTELSTYAAGLNANLADILNRDLTSDDQTQVTMQDRTSEFLASTSIKGGYSGPAISYPVVSGKYYYLDFPWEEKYLSADENLNEKYFTVWVALQTETSPTKSITFYTGTNYVFNGTNLAYARNNITLAAGTAPQWDATGSKGFDINCWYQLYIPLQTVADANTNGSISLLRMYTEITKNDGLENYKLLIGNFGVATQEEMNSAKEMEKAEILTELTAKNYSQYKLEGRTAEFLSSTDFDTASGYTGPAVAFTTIANKKLSIDFPKGQQYLTKEESTTGLYFTVWVALQHSGDDLTGDLKFEGTKGYLFQKDTLSYVRNNNTFVLKTNHVEWGRTDRDAGFELNKWYQLYIPLQNVVDGNTDDSLAMFHVVYGQKQGNIQEVCKLLVGNIGVATQAELDALKNATE